MPNAPKKSMIWNTLDTEGTGLLYDFQSNKKNVGMLQLAMTSERGGRLHIDDYWSDILLEPARLYKQGEMSATQLMQSLAKGDKRNPFDWGMGITRAFDDDSGVIGSIFKRSMDRAMDHIESPLGKTAGAVSRGVATSPTHFQTSRFGLSEVAMVEKVVDRLGKGEGIQGWNIGYDLGVLTQAAKRHGRTDLVNKIHDAWSGGQVREMAQDWYEVLFREAAAKKITLTHRAFEHESMSMEQLQAHKERITQSLSEPFKPGTKYDTTGLDRRSNPHAVTGRAIEEHTGFRNLFERMQDADGNLLPEYKTNLSYSGVKASLEGGGPHSALHNFDFKSGRVAPDMQYVSGWGQDALGRALRLDDILGPNAPENSPGLRNLRNLNAAHEASYDTLRSLELKRLGKTYTESGRQSFLNTLQKEYRLSEDEFLFRMQQSAELGTVEKSFEKKLGHVSFDEAGQSFAAQYPQGDGLRSRPQVAPRPSEPWLKRLGGLYKEAGSEVRAWSLNQWKNHKTRTAVFAGLAALLVGHGMLPGDTTNPDPVDRRATSVMQVAKHQRFPGEGLRTGDSRYLDQHGIQTSPMAGGNVSHYGSGRDWIRQLGTALERVRDSHPPLGKHHEVQLSRALTTVARGHQRPLIVNQGVPRIFPAPNYTPKRAPVSEFGLEGLVSGGARGTIATEGAEYVKRTQGMAHAPPHKTGRRHSLYQHVGRSKATGSSYSITSGLTDAGTIRQAGSTRTVGMNQIPYVDVKGLRVAPPEYHLTTPSGMSSSHVGLHTNPTGSHTIFTSGRYGGYHGKGLNNPGPQFFQGAKPDYRHMTGELPSSIDGLALGGFSGFNQSPQSSWMKAPFGSPSDPSMLMRGNDVAYNHTQRSWAQFAWENPAMVGQIGVIAAQTLTPLGTPAGWAGSRFSDAAKHQMLGEMRAMGVAEHQALRELNHAGIAMPAVDSRPPGAWARGKAAYKEGRSVFAMAKEGFQGLWQRFHAGIVQHAEALHDAEGGWASALNSKWKREIGGIFGGFKTVPLSKRINAFYRSVVLQSGWGGHHNAAEAMRRAGSAVGSAGMVGRANVVGGSKATTSFFGSKKLNAGKNSIGAWLAAKGDSMRGVVAAGSPGYKSTMWAAGKYKSAGKGLQRLSTRKVLGGGLGKAMFLLGTHFRAQEYGGGLRNYAAGAVSTAVDFAAFTAITKTGTYAGAAVGGAIGSLFAGVGAAPGAAVGAVVGTVVGFAAAMMYSAVAGDTVMGLIGQKTASNRLTSTEYAALHAPKNSGEDYRFSHIPGLRGSMDTGMQHLKPSGMNESDFGSPHRTNSKDLQPRQTVRDNPRKIVAPPPALDLPHTDRKMYKNRSKIRDQRTRLFNARVVSPIHCNRSRMGPVVQGHN